MDFTIDTDRQQTTPQTPPPRTVRRRLRRAGLWTLLGMGLTSVAAAIAVLVLLGQTLRAPDWLRNRIEARIERELGGLQIGFGDVAFVVNKGWRPRLHLRDVTLSDGDGRRIAQLADAEATLAMRPLLRGQVQPKRILLSGLFATLRRDADGNFALLLGSDRPMIENAASLPQLLANWSGLLAREQFHALVSVETDALTLRYEDARQGRAWTLDGGRIALERDGADLTLNSGFVLLSGGDYASAFEASYSGRVGSMASEFAIAVRDIHAGDIAAQTVALAWLDVLRAPISGSLQGSTDKAGLLGPLSASLAIGAGVLQPTDQTKPVPFSGARTSFTYAPDQQVLIFDELAVDSAWGSGSAEGRAYLEGIENGRLAGLIGQFTFGALSINPADIYDAPVELSGAAADFRLELKPFRMTLGQMHVSDGRTRVDLSGEMSAQEGGWQLAVDGRLDRLTPERLIKLWPTRFLDKPRDWVAQNLSGGVLRDIDIALRADAGRKPELYLDFDYSGATIRFLKTMPPVTGAVGQATLIDRRLVVTASGGQVLADEGGAVEVAGTSFIIPDTSIRKATPAGVELKLDGSVTAMLSLLNRPPIAVLKATKLPVDLAEGRAQVSGAIALPLMKKIPIEQISFDFAGKIQNAQSAVLVPGQVLRFASLDLSGDQDAVRIAGSGSIGQVPLSIAWEQPIARPAPDESRVSGQIELSQRLIDTFALGLPRGTVSGQGTGDFTLNLRRDQPPSLELTSDMAGLGLSIPQLGWRKVAGATGQFQLSATLGPTPRVDRMQLQAPGLAATGAVVSRSGGGLERALLSSVRVGDWLEASVELVGRGVNQAPDIRILNGMLDLRRAEFETVTPGGGGGGGQLEVALDRLQVNDTIALTGFTGRFRSAGGLDGAFAARVNGATEVTGRIVPKSGRSAIRLQSDDAGGVIRSAGLLTQGRGGQLDLTLTPTGAPGQFDGVARITDTRIIDAPAIAALLDAVSIVGLLDEMSGKGIQFTEVDAQFRLTPSLVTVFASSAVGPSIGLSMDGTFDVGRKWLDMRGVISPVYLINSIGSFLTRKGEGVFGFNYTLKGPSERPSVTVNPLSALAPGMFRDVLRDAPPPTGGEATSRPAPAGGRDRSKGVGGKR